MIEFAVLHECSAPKGAQELIIRIPNIHVWIPNTFAAGRTIVIVMC
jgi:hypothetical protein